MRAQRIVQPDAIESGPLRAADAPLPQPAPGELLLSVQACGVCRTDLHLAEGDLEARRLPLVPGHQIVGRVEALGSGVDGWEVGERAGAAWLAGACGACRFCQSERENLCREGTFTGWDRDGGYAEFVAVRADFALRLPASFADLEAAPLLCGGVIGYRALRVSGIESGGRLGLYGFGASAALAIQVAVHWGCEVFVVTRSQREQERALGFGCGVGGVLWREAARTIGRRDHLCAGWRRRRPRAASSRAGRHGGDQRDPSRPHPAVRLRRSLVGASDSQRRQLHPPGCPAVPRACGQRSRFRRCQSRIGWGRRTRRSAGSKPVRRRVRRCWFRSCRGANSAPRGAAAVAVGHER